MALECYHYKYNNNNITTDANDKPCQDSFEECRELKSCPKSDNPTPYHCFAAAQYVTKLKDGINITTVNIISAGCWPPHSDEQCQKECLGYPQAGKRLLCCCSESKCNLVLKPQANPLPLKSTTTPIPPIPDSSLNSHNTNSTDFVNLPVMLFVILSIFVTLLVSNCYKKRRKRNSGTITNDSNNTQVGHDYNEDSIIGNHVQNNYHQHHHMNKNTNNLNATELNDLRHNNDVAILMPLKEESNNQSRTGDSNNNNKHNNNFPPTASNANRGPPPTNSVDQAAMIQSKLLELNDISLNEVVGSGRFGRVHRAMLLSESKEIAVKVIPTKECQSWQNELEIYCSNRTKHPNVLDFYGWCENVETNCHWLCLMYASRGSLHHYLKDNTITWPEFLAIALGIMRGLSHLHDFNVVHRDFKSKNVLLRQDLSPCITDFGVATIMDVIDPGSQQKKLLQVGTPRYMSPEILECSIVFGIKNFMKIDIYAAALVIWELLTRCYPLPVPNLSNIEEPVPYRLPYAEYVGSDPDIDTMRQIVCKTRQRPMLRPEWEIHPIEPICRSLKESWEYDEDARVSSTCFVERIERLCTSTETIRGSDEPSSVVAAN